MTPTYPNLGIEYATIRDHEGDKHVCVIRTNLRKQYKKKWYLQGFLVDEVGKTQADAVKGAASRLAHNIYVDQLLGKPDPSRMTLDADQRSEKEKYDYLINKPLLNSK